MHHESPAGDLVAKPRLVKNYMAASQATDAAFLKRRCRATEAMGLMATAVGKDVIGPMVQDIMQAAVKVQIQTALCSCVIPGHMQVIFAPAF